MNDIQQLIAQARRLRQDCDKATAALQAYAQWRCGKAAVGYMQESNEYWRRSLDLTWDAYAAERGVKRSYE